MQHSFVYQGTIDSLSKKGCGVGHFSNEDLTKKFEAPFTIVGEEVELFKPKKGPNWPLRIVSPSPYRVEARCIHFGACGGCTYQHMSYQEEMRQKELAVRDLFGEEKVRPIIGALKEWNYRNKMEFTFSSDREGRRYLGLIAKESKGRVFNLKECPLADPFVVEALEKVRHFWEKSALLAYNPYKDTGSLRTLTIRTGRSEEEKMVALTVSGNTQYALKKGQVALFKEVMGPISTFLIIQQALKGRPTQFFEIHLNGKDHIEEELKMGDRRLKFRISPRAFFQPNTVQAEVIYQTAIGLLDIQADEVVYDLFCGTGTLSLFAACKALEVIGIELSFEAIVDAEENAKRNAILNARFLQGDVGQVLERGGLPQADSILCDPPRGGLTLSQIEQIVRLQAKKILYISCNPITLAQNVETFLGMGYDLKCVQPIDQFAKTPHLEAVALLVKHKEMR